MNPPLDSLFQSQEVLSGDGVKTSSSTVGCYKDLGYKFSSQCGHEHFKHRCRSREFAAAPSVFPALWLLLSEAACLGCYDSNRCECGGVPAVPSWHPPFCCAGLSFVFVFVWIIIAKAVTLLFICCVSSVTVDIRSCLHCLCSPPALCISQPLLWVCDALCSHECWEIPADSEEPGFGFFLFFFLFPFPPGILQGPLFKWIKFLGDSLPEISVLNESLSFLSGGEINTVLFLAFFSGLKMSRKVEGNEGCPCPGWFGIRVRKRGCAFITGPGNHAAPWNLKGSILQVAPCLYQGETGEFCVSCMKLYYRAVCRRFNDSSWVCLSLQCSKCLVWIHSEITPSLCLS